jgi:hypothetical protein
MRCGVYGCPQEQVAEEAKADLLEDKFRRGRVRVVPPCAMHIAEP